MVPRGLSVPIISTGIVRPRLRSSKRQTVRAVNFCAGTHLVMHIHERSNEKGRETSAIFRSCHPPDSRMTRGQIRMVVYVRCCIKDLLFHSSKRVVNESRILESFRRQCFFFPYTNVNRYF